MCAAEMMKLSKTMIRTLTAAVVVAVVLVTAVYLLTGSSNKKVAANFASGVGVYPGTPVKVLGIQVGSVSKVTPEGAFVRVEMTYGSKYKVPANAGAFLVANSLVSDRYVQLAPVYTTGDALPSGATIPLSRTASPAELDDIYGALNKLSVALGPTGANKDGALSALVNVGAANLKGNGAALASSVQNLSKAASTLANSRTDLFGTVTNLRNFTDRLNQSDAQVRSFNTLLAQVSGDLANERADLGSALHNLTVALHSVADFVNTNAAKIHTGVIGLEQLSNILVAEQGPLNESLTLAPYALANLTHAYQETTGTLGTKSNLGSIANIGQLCQLLGATSGPVGLVGSLLNGLGLSAQVASTCKTLLGSLNLSAPSGSSLGSALTSNLPGVSGG
ncbi:MAG: MCE family protein [Actinomycetota bacterium]|nr:MCE family protein [Actinomycetota bacterium]